MISLFLGLTVLNLLCLSAATTLGYLRHYYGGYETHRLVGALTALTCCGVHCVVFTYFAATAKWVQHAVSVKGLDASLVAPTRSFKAQAFPAALLAIGAVLLAAFSGAGSDNYRGGWIAAHHVLSLAALVVNFAVVPIEYRAISRNGRLIDQILATIAGLETKTASSTTTSPGNL